MTDPTPTATVVIPQFGGGDLTCACIGSLRRAETIPWPIIVVDDGSPLEARRIVAVKRFPDTTLIHQSHRGVSAAWNLGAAQVRTPYVVFLNNDVLFQGPVMERLLWPLISGEARMSGIRLRTERSLPVHTFKKLPGDRFLEGWCLATSLADFQRLGGFDDSMAIYWSDTDFQARMMIETARIDCPTVRPLIELPALPLVHLGHRTAHRMQEHRGHWLKDRNEFLKKWNAR